MIIIEGKSRKSIALAECINNNIGRDKRVIMFDSVDVPVLQFQIKREYEHYIMKKSFEELIFFIYSTKYLLRGADVLVFECNISKEQLQLFDKYQFDQQIIVTVQTDDIGCKVHDTENLGG